MFQMFYVCFNVSKVDLDVAYVAMVVHVCCKCLSPNVPSVFCTRMLQVFQTHVLSISSVFSSMLQVLHLDVSKVDRDVTHVAMVFQLYVLNVSSILDVCCKCFVWMLQKWIEVLHGAAGGCRCASPCDGRGRGAECGRGSGAGWPGHSLTETDRFDSSILYKIRLPKN
jgi:hypothetical protein